MKVLMLNGSSKPNGNTFLALEAVGKQLEKEGIALPDTHAEVRTHFIR